MAGGVPRLMAPRTRANHSSSGATIWTLFRPSLISSAGATQDLQPSGSEQRLSSASNGERSRPLCFSVTKDGKNQSSSCTTAAPNGQRSCLVSKISWRAAWGDRSPETLRSRSTANVHLNMLLISTNLYEAMTLNLSRANWPCANSAFDRFCTEQSLNFPRAIRDILTPVVQRKIA